jgi:hypothetical protein
MKTMSISLVALYVTGFALAGPAVAQTKSPQPPQGQQQQQYQGPLGADGKPMADNPANRTLLAQELLKVQSMDSIIGDIIESMARSVPQNEQARLRDYMRRNLDINAIRASAVQSMTKTFTVNELAAMVDFYGSDEGQSIQKKLGTYMTDLSPALQNVMQNAMAKYRKQYPASGAAGGAPQPAPAPGPAPSPGYAPGPPIRR